MQSDRRISTISTTSVRKEHRKRSYSNGTFRRRDRQDLICVICLAPAIGYNFDQITCESCKAFFRRNALTNADKFKCRTGTNDCMITLDTRKRCKYCRLKKCFDKGLRKDWIMSEEEKRTKKQKIEDNRRLRAMSILSQSASSLSVAPDDQMLPSTLNRSDDSCDSTTSNECKPSTDDRLVHSLTKIAERYRKAVQLNVSVIKGCTSPCLRYMDDLIDVLNEPTHLATLRLITFFKLTPEFNSLHEDDRLLLVKHNLMVVLGYHFCICVDINTGIYHEPDTPNEYSYEASALRKYSDSLYYQMIDWSRKLKHLCADDHLILKLLILIVIFSKGVEHMEPVLVESTKVFYSQCAFVDILWNYLNLRFGDGQASLMFPHIAFSLMKAYAMAREAKEDVTRQTSETADELVPLMKSVVLS
ncbi:unnamed protein product [Adineta ricciae]|uniref:Nuclear receptor domain-containing protein n=1 Tax=Adineta ricciae TaxID=249248 RepID=A0A813XNC3_ADIRI|nr:unnamed protein product [Adineta ricciae]CAF0872830.1 unnamed protein product [Adineta ricciae]